ncbi:MAG: hypothetical protein KBA61_06785 [Spirochaetes bacterium]|nr:hypothetical protein [Spirochaetota bacterium]
MTTDTTVVMRGGIQAALERGIRISGRSRTALVVMAMKRMMGKRGGLARAFRCIEYQERGCAWRRVHVRVYARDLEFFSDMRLVFKRSVSLLIAMAIERHLDEILRDDCADNYPFPSRVLYEEIVNSVVCWKIYWGIPPNL